MFEIINAADRTFLRCRSIAGAVPEPFVHLWLNSVRGQGFFSWQLRQSTAYTEAFTEISSAVTLQDELREILKPSVLESVLRQLCEALDRIDKSLLPPSRVILRPDHIWLYKTGGSLLRASEYQLKLLYYPYLREDQKEAFASSDAERNEVLLLLCRKLAASRSGRRDREKNIRLLEAAAEGASAVLDCLNAQSRAAFAKPGQQDKLPEVSETALAEISPESSNGAPPPAGKEGRPDAPSLSGKKVFPLLARLQAPLFLLAAELLILLMIYLADRLMQPMPLSLLIILVGLLAVCCLWQILLLLLPVSPYCIFRASGRLKPVEDTAIRSISAETDPELHPAAENRTAILTLMNKADRGKSKASWQILHQEFLIGTDPDKASLCLEQLTEEKEMILRICQRAGVFYAQALSSTQPVYLQDRLLYRYEDYQLPDECRLRIKHLIFRFRAY